MDIHEKTVEQTKLAAYYIWQYSGYENTKSLWYCVEDAASFLEHHQILDEAELGRVLSLPHTNHEYVEFMRQMAYRLHIFTGIADEGFNWHIAEQLYNITEWRAAVLAVANALSALRTLPAHKTGYRPFSPAVKELYRG